jgi:hypothetical protein
MSVNAIANMFIQKFLFNSIFYIKQTCLHIFVIKCFNVFYLQKIQSQ